MCTTVTTPMLSAQFLSSLTEENAIACQRLINARLKEIHAAKNKAIRFSGTFSKGDKVKFFAKKANRTGIFKRWQSRNGSVEEDGTKKTYSIQPRKLIKLVTPTPTPSLPSPPVPAPSLSPPKIEPNPNSPTKPQSQPTPKPKTVTLPTPTPVPIESLFPELHLQAIPTKPAPLEPLTPTQLAQIQKNREEALKKRARVRFTTASLKLKEQEKERTQALENEKRQTLILNPIPRQETTQIGNKMVITTTTNEIDIETGLITRTNVKSTTSIDLVMLDD